MDKQDNPFMNLIQIMREQGQVFNPTPYLVGKVVSASPFLVQVNGLTIEREDILINYSLENGLLVGDRVVLLMSQDQQEFILVCKVR